jgi:alkanesulfonate monooxygenase SsuD/methylene tetrahydromethanopterin reductase-like flavin-dependent oxidoreductase (luciferase family)
MREADERFEESIGVILKAWTSDQRFTHHGKYWQFDDIIVEPPTRQKPHPPVWMGAGSPASIAKVAKRGANVMFDQFATTEMIGERLELYKKACAEVGRPFDPIEVAVARAVYVAKNAAEKQELLDQRLAAQQRTHALAQAPDGSNKSSMMTFADLRAASDESALFGTPDEIADKLERLRKLGVEHVLINNPGKAAEGLRSFARELMPAFASAPRIRAVG